MFLIRKFILWVGKSLGSKLCWGLILTEEIHSCEDMIELEMMYEKIDSFKNSCIQTGDFEYYLSVKKAYDFREKHLLLFKSNHVSFY